MDDNTLATQLLSVKPRKVVLVGKPVWRLNAVLVGLLDAGSSGHASSGAGSNPVAAPQINEYDNIDQFIDSDDRISHDHALCLHLSKDADDPEKVLGVACRASPELVLLEHSSSTASSELLGDEHFFAFGFRRIGQAAEVSGLQQRWYAYRLRDYKQSPDWLNARFWAHPERYDQQD